MAQLIAFHGKKEIKTEYLNRVKAHQKADEIVKGKYWEHGKGCAVGCTIHGGDHGRYESELGIPRIIARLEDGIFEGLPAKEAKAFPAKFLNAITPGADLSQVGDKFLHWLLVDPVDGVIKYANTDRIKKAIQDVGDMYARKISGEIINSSIWQGLRTAYAAADAAAYAAAYAAAAYADADAAAYAAAYAAAAAADADADADADAWRKNREKSRIVQMNKLLELLKQAPVIKIKKAA